MRFEVFFKIDNIPLDQDPDSNWAKILDPDPNSMYVFRSLDLEHCLQLWSYQDEQALKTDTINLSWLTGTWDHAAVVTMQWPCRSDPFLARTRAMKKGASPGPAQAPALTCVYRKVTKILNNNVK